MYPKQVQRKDPNEGTRIVLWIAFGLYVVTTFVPVISFTFFFSVEFMIYEVFPIEGIVLFFGALLSCGVAVSQVKNNGQVRLFAFLSVGCDILPIVALWYNLDYFEPSIGFFTLVGGGVLSLVGGIKYKNPQNVMMRTIRAQQNPIAYQQGFEEGYKYSQNQEEYTPPMEILIVRNCPNCESECEIDTKFCQSCGKELKEE